MQGICGIQYVGETKRPLRDRLRDHFRHIRQNDPEKIIGRHFNSEGHTGTTEQVKTFILSFIFDLH